MNSPLTLLQALLLGCALGLFYGFMRPFRPRWLGDFLFILALFWVRIYLGFGLCGGDLRLTYTTTLCAGIFLWESAFGRPLQPAFLCFWKGFSRIFLRILRPFKNISKKMGYFINAFLF